MAEQEATLPTWARALAIVVGVISIICAIIVVLFPGIAILTLVLILSVALMFIGIDRLAAGISGHPYRYVTMVPIRPMDATETTSSPVRSAP
jgi:uncharacterized membrane protein